MTGLIVAGLLEIDSGACSSDAPAPKAMNSNSEVQGGLAEGYQAAVINEITIGRLLMLNKAGDIVWEYFCPFRYARNSDYVCRVMHATRYAPDEIDFELNHAQTAAKD